MPELQRSAADFYLTIDGVQYPFYLWADPSGRKTMNDALAPMLTPQVRTAGFGYEHLPPDIEVISSLEGFSGGAGYEHHTPTSFSSLGLNTANDPKVYNYAQGLDLSWGETGTLALQRRSTSAVSANPVKFFPTSLGLFLIAGAYLYKWDLATTSWVLKSDRSADSGGVAYQDIAELNGVLYACRGNATKYDYSTDGTTWTAFSDAATYPDYFANRGNGSDLAGLWAVITNVLKVTTNGQNSGVAWAGSTAAGSSGQTVRGLVTVNNNIYVFKKEGIFLYDGTHIQDLWVSNYLDANNGKQAYQFTDGFIYSTYGRRILRVNPFASASTSDPIDIVYPRADMDSLELLGDVTAITGDESYLYIAVKNAAGNSYILKGIEQTDGSFVWHPIAYLGAHDCNALRVTGPGVMHATNPCLALMYAQAANYIVLPRQGLHPNEDSACTYETSEGVMYGAFVDFGAKTFPKFLNRGAVLTNGATAGRYVKLNYEADHSGVEVSLVNAYADPLSEANVSATTSFHLVRMIVRMMTGDASTSPQLEALAFGATPNPKRKLTWAPTVDMSERQETRDGFGTDSTPSSAVIVNALRGAVQKRVTLTDHKGLTYTVRLTDVKNLGLKDKDNGGREYEDYLYSLPMVEIQTLTTDASTGTYGNDSYGRGKVFA